MFLTASLPSSHCVHSSPVNPVTPDIYSTCLLPDAANVSTASHSATSAEHGQAGRDAEANRLADKPSALDPATAVEGARRTVRAVGTGRGRDMTLPGWMTGMLWLLHDKKLDCNMQWEPLCACHEAPMCTLTV